MRVRKDSGFSFKEVTVLHEAIAPQYVFWIVVDYSNMRFASASGERMVNQDFQKKRSFDYDLNQMKFNRNGIT